MVCRAELVGLRTLHEALVRRGGGVVAVCVDPPEQNREVVEALELPFPIVADVGRSTVRDWGVLHAGGGPKGSDIALPAQFLIDRTGRVRWSSVAAVVTGRPNPDELLQRLPALLGE